MFDLWKSDTVVGQDTMIGACLTCEELGRVWLVRKWQGYWTVHSDRGMFDLWKIRVCLTCEESGHVWLVKNWGVFDLWRSNRDVRQYTVIKTLRTDSYVGQYTVIKACLTCKELTVMLDSTQWLGHVWLVKKWQLCWTVPSDHGMFDLMAVPQNRKDYFLCTHLGIWIPWLYVCNGDHDCANNADEVNCDPCECLRELNFHFDWHFPLTPHAPPHCFIVAVLLCKWTVQPVSCTRDDLRVLSQAAWTWAFSAKLLV